MVDPDAGGMSVAFQPDHLPTWRRPPEHGGDGPDPLWEMDENELPDGLVCRADSPTHATIEPAGRMPLEDYEDLLAETGDLWKEAESGLG